jgi:hypothetical protein
LQKLGPDSQRNLPMTGLELEIAREQAETLGLAGKRLQESIDRLNSAGKRQGAAVQHDELLSEIASRAWALMVQRELIGFKHENLRWIMDRFEIPDAALKKLGRSDG